jgi:hypothetical protein
MNSPGWVWTPLAGASSGKDKPNAPWTAEQTVDYMFEKVFDNGDFYVICPDNEVTSVSHMLILDRWELICRTWIKPVSPGL